MRMVLAAILGCVCWSSLPAAEVGRIEGTVHDASQAVVPGVLVSAIEEETGFQFAAATGGNGEFHLKVPAGHYHIVARRVGFRTVSRLSVLVAAGGSRTVDFELQAGSVFETVTVSDSVPRRGSGRSLPARPSSGRMNSQDCRSPTGPSLAYCVSPRACWSHQPTVASPGRSPAWGRGRARTSTSWMA